MNITVWYRPAVSRASVFIHAWDQNGLVCDVPGAPSADGQTFRFTIVGTTQDQRDVSFKYRFGPDDWESDNFIRTVPSLSATELWTVDYSARCATAGPGEPANFAGIAVHAISERRYNGGQLFVWTSDSDGARLPESHRDETTHTSTFAVPLSAARQSGFYFKLIGLGDQRDFSDFEPDRSNRFWQPSDGAEIWIKSGQIDVRSEAIASLSVAIDFVFPPLLGTPQLHVEDLLDDFDVTLAPAPPVVLDANFVITRYSLTVFAGAIYNLWWSTEPQSMMRRFSIPLDEPAGPSVALNGYDQWLPAIPAANGHIELTIHPNPGSAFGTNLEVGLGVGDAAAHQSVNAARQPDGA
ncbi:MAG: hypothetical protein JO091_01860, partial [Acidobacteriaceae bacterium]|nr:hypothetical protein [Acidobacteriaceae bacterium]